MPSDESGRGGQHAFVGTCQNCDHQMVETARSADSESRTVQMRCQNDRCGAVGTVHHEFGVDPTENPETQADVEDLRTAVVNWIDCPRCDGHGWVSEPLCDLQTDRDNPCPRCHTSGAVLGEVTEVAG
jgi:hypothetical protein